MTVNRFFIRAAYFLIDVIVIVGSLYLSAEIRQGSFGFEVTFYNLFFSEENPFRLLFNLWVILTILGMSKKSLYETRREVLEGYAYTKIIRAVIISSSLIIVGVYALKLTDFPRSVMLWGASLMIFSLCLWRAIKREFVKYLVCNGYNNFNTLIIGGTRVGVALAKEIETRPQLGINIVGFLDDHKQNLNDSNYSIVGKVNDFREIANREFIKKIFITISNDEEKFTNILEEARDLGIAVRVVPQGYQLLHKEIEFYNLGIFPIIEYIDGSPGVIQRGKRLFDLVFSFIGIIFTLPIFLLISLAIRFDSSGPAFYLSNRYGKNGKKFKMIKFRSMRIDADDMLADLTEDNEVDGPIFKIKDDPRITSVGRFLRKFSLDELPQLFNVFVGDMSLVGPRPLPIDQIEKEDLKQLKRLEVRPGITGLWQIKGRSDISFSRLLKWDIWYIKNWSFWLDLNILMLTIPAVIKGRGAY